MLGDVNDMCRLCLSKEGLMLPIFRSRSIKNETDFRYKIMSCTSIEVFADDDLPMNVCYLCVHQVEKFFQFQSMCENSDAFLRSQLKESVVENKIDFAINPDTENSLIAEQYSTTATSINNFGSEYYEKSDKLYCNEKSDLDVYSCFICSFICLSNDTLISHLMKNHSNINSYTCKKCEISFSNISKFKAHLNLQHSLTCSHCDYVFKYQKSLQQHLKTHLNKNFTCKYCKKQFDEIHELKRHEIIHSDMTCNYCSKEFNFKQDYYAHADECVKKYRCIFCEQSLLLKKDLIEHVNSCHNMLNKCSKCKQPFEKLEEIQDHICKTNVDSTFQCKNCQASFMDEPSLLEHITQQHNGNVLTCKFCTKKFSLKSSLKRHEKSHSGVKPYQCKFCPRKFKDSSACVVHTRTHTGEHPFQCKECHKDFKQLANLKMHTYRHHKKNLKSVEEKIEVLNQEINDYEHFYSGSTIENYPDNNIRGYQHLSESVSATFNQSINILISEHH